ncbi:MAG TPA: hypothetical protein QGF58_07355 [Myxococcota bacterium]|nr:hypothetical protein [Myxococcota bacterium]
MKRLTLAILAVGLTTGCTVTKYDGTYIIFHTLTKNTVDPDDTDIGKEERGLATIATTTEGTLVMDWGGVVMVGEMGDKKAFSVEREVGLDTSDEDCATRVDKQTISADGLFTKDGGVTATIDDLAKYTVKDCDPQDDVDETWEYSWDLTGVQINANDGNHLGDDANWGYAPNPVY